MDLVETLILLVFVSTASAATMDATPRPCGILSNLSACSSYIYGNPRSPIPPSTDCCNTLNFILHTKPLCLCKVVQSDSYLVQNRAVDLPRSCNVTTPPVSLCPRETSSGHGTKMLVVLQLLCFLTAVVGIV